MEPDHWPGVEIRHLAALKAVSETGSFGRAAERLGYTQSAISQQVATLEKAVGTRLVERPGGPRPISMTEAGMVLLRHADGIVARIRAAQADLAALASGDAGSLRVGTYQSVGARVLPEVMRRFAESFPGIEVHLTEGEDGQLLGLIEEGGLDLCFVQMPIADGPFESMELLREPYVLVVKADSPLAKRDRAPSLKELGSIPLIGFRTCRSVGQIEQHLTMRGIPPDIVFRSDDNGIVQGMVAAGVGSALLPLMAVDLRDERTVAIDLDGKLPPRVIGVAWHRDRHWSPAAESFVNLAASVTDCLELPAARASA